MIYGDIESLIKKKITVKKNLYHQKFCESLREHTKNVIDFG